jgi:hypothetical protein
MEMQVRVHADLLAMVVKDRQLNQVYQTNKRIKLVAAYYLLKAMTTSGVIKRDRLGEIMHVLDVEDQRTVSRILNACERARYLQITPSSIILASYPSFVETFDAPFTRMVSIRYAPGKAKFHHLMEATYLQLAEQRRQQVFENKLKAIPELEEELKQLVSPDKNGNYSGPLCALQIQTFIHGHEKKAAIFALNPFSACNTKTLRKNFAFKSEQSVAYLKAKLQRAKLLTVKPREITSQTKQHLKKRFTEWDQQKQQTVWVLPDRLEYAPFLTLNKN